MKIGELATQTGVSRDTLRFYEKRGLIRARRAQNGYRDYPPELAPFVLYIRTAQPLGFTLAEIGVAAEQIGDGDDAARVATLLREKIESIDRRIGELQALRTELSARLGDVCPLRQHETVVSA